MDAVVIVGIVTSCLALSLILLANIVLVMMIGEINRAREQGKLVPCTVFPLPKMLRILGEYKRLYPAGELLVYALAAAALALIGLISLAVWLRSLA